MSSTSEILALQTPRLRGQTCDSAEQVTQLDLQSPLRGNIEAALRAQVRHKDRADLLFLTLGAIF